MSRAHAKLYLPSCKDTPPRQPLPVGGVFSCLSCSPRLSSHQPLIFRHPAQTLPGLPASTSRKSNVYSTEDSTSRRPARAQRGLASTCPKGRRVACSIPTCSGSRFPVITDLPPTTSFSTSLPGKRTTPLPSRTPPSAVPT